MTMQKDTESTEQRHEESGTRAPTQLAQFFRQRSRDAKPVSSAAIRCCRPWTIHRQIQNRRSAGKLVFPIIQLLRQDIALQPIALPFGEVGILKWQRRVR